MSEMYYIIPTNEGHEINYVERSHESPERVDERARFIARELQRILPRASIAVKVEDAHGKGYVIDGTDFEDRIAIIMKNIHIGVGNHGHFLRAFAECYCVADPENKVNLSGTAESLIRKYNLTKPEYLKET